VPDRIVAGRDQIVAVLLGDCSTVSVSQQQKPNFPDMVVEYMLVWTLEDCSCRQLVTLTSWHAVVVHIRWRKAIQDFKRQYYCICCSAKCRVSASLTFVLNCDCIVLGEQEQLTKTDSAADRWE